MKKRRLSLAVARALGVGASLGLVVPLVHAQQQPAAPPAPPVERVQKIEVTGSRIPLETLESESPVQLITQQEIKYTGLTNIADVLNQLPQVAPGYGQMLSNGSLGTATVDLRNLGDARTLVLIDGRRVPAGDPRHWAADLNAIPASLIQRVDVLTGGASAVYGSDALAGVVNFIMNDHFEGVQFEYNANGYNHQQHSSTISSIVAARAETNPAQYQVPGNIGLDGVNQDFNLTLGGNFAGGKGNASVYFEYRHSNPVLQASRDFSACALMSTPTGYVCGGSSTAYPGRFFDINTGNNWTIANAAGDVRPFDRSSDLFNFAPTNYYQVPDERYLANFFAHYDAFPNVRVYTEFDFMDAKTVLQIAPSGTFFGNQLFTLTNDNPLLSQSFKNAFGITATSPGELLIGRRNIEGGGRQDVPRHTDYRIVIGAKGDVGNWDYDLWWQSGRNVYQDTYLHDYSNVRTIRALDVVKGPNGQPVCASVVDGTDPQCVPWDIFHIGGVTQAALNYLETPGFQNGQTSQSVVGLHLTSDLGSAYGWKLPWAKNGIGVAAGIEHRTEKLSLDTSTSFSTADLAGQGGPVIGLQGQYTVNEAFGEIRVPIMEGQRWADELAVNGSYRYSSYSTGPRTNTYGLGAEWAPVKEARLRGTYQRAIRAANIIELFTPQAITPNANFSVDPCGPTMSATLAQCLLTGLQPSQYGAIILDNPALQYNQIEGGNPQLIPEKSSSYTAGIVLQPMPNLSATIDYWNIKIDNTIGQLDAALVLNTCLAQGQLCGFIHRDPRLGTLWISGGYISVINVNIGTKKTDGIDVTLNGTYRFDSYGNLALSFTGTWVDQFITSQAPGLGSYNCAGLYGAICGTPLPRWRHVLTTTWNTPWSWNTGFRWRYFDSVAIDASSSNPQLSAPFDPVVGKIGAQSYLDLFAQWNINKNFTLRGGVNNVFDHDPPITSSQSAPFFNGNTYPQGYDTLGRNFFINVQAKF